MFVRGSSSTGKKKEHKLKLFGPDIFRCGGDLPREGVGAKKFGMSLETQGKQTFGWENPASFARISRGAPEKFEKTMFVFYSIYSCLLYVSCRSPDAQPIDEIVCVCVHCRLHGSRTKTLMNLLSRIFAILASSCIVSCPNDMQQVFGISEICLEADREF